MLVTLRYGPRKISGISGMSLYLATLSIKILKKEKEIYFSRKEEEAIRTLHRFYWIIKYRCRLLSRKQIHLLLSILFSYRFEGIRKYLNEILPSRNRKCWKREWDKHLPRKRIVCGFIDSDRFSFRARCFYF